MIREVAAWERVRNACATPADWCNSVDDARFELKRFNPINTTVMEHKGLTKDLEIPFRRWAC